MFQVFFNPFFGKCKEVCHPSFLICQCDNILAIFRHITGFSSHGLWNLSIIDTIPFHFGSRSPNYTAYICLVRTPFLTQGHVDLMTQQSRVLPWSMLTWVRTNKWKSMWKTSLFAFQVKGVISNTFLHVAPWWQVMVRRACKSLTHVPIRSGVSRLMMQTTYVCKHCPEIIPPPLLAGCQWQCKNQQYHRPHGHYTGGELTAKYPLSLLVLTFN